MPDPSFEWDWFLFNYLFWLPILLVWWVVQRVKDHRQRRDLMRRRPDAQSEEIQSSEKEQG